MRLEEKDKTFKLLDMFKTIEVDKKIVLAAYEIKNAATHLFAESIFNFIKIFK